MRLFKKARLQLLKAAWRCQGFLQITRSHKQMRLLRASFEIHLPQHFYQCVGRSLGRSWVLTHNQSAARSHNGPLLGSTGGWYVHTDSCFSELMFKAHSLLKQQGIQVQYPYTALSSLHYPALVFKFF